MSELDNWESHDWSPDDQKCRRCDAHISDKQPCPLPNDKEGRRAMAAEKMTLMDRLRSPQYVQQGGAAYLDVVRTRADLDAAADKIKRLEQTLDEIPRLIETAFKEWKKDESLRDMLDDITANIGVLRIVHSTDEDALHAGIAEYGSEEAWRSAMGVLRERMLSGVEEVRARQGKG